MQQDLFAAVGALSDDALLQGAQRPAPPAAATVAPAAPRPMAPPRPAAVVQPLTAEHYKVQVTVTGAAVDKLRQLRDLLSHTRLDDAALLERALDALLEKELKRRFALTDRPRPARPCDQRAGPARGVTPLRCPRGRWSRGRRTPR